MVLLFTEKKIYQKELMIIMKQIKKINLKSQVRAELEEYIHSLDLDVAKNSRGKRNSAVFSGSAG